MPQKDILALAGEALVPILRNVATDPRRLKPGELIRLLNSTPLGQVLDDRRLRSHRAKAGMRIGDDKSIDLFRYAAWLHEQHSKAPPEPPETVWSKAEQLGISASMLHRWFNRGCPNTSVAAIRAWRDEHVLPRQGGPRTFVFAHDRDAEDDDAQRGILRARRDKELQQARALKLKTDVLEGKLVEKADVVREYAEQFAVARSILDGLPDSLAKEAPAELRTAAYTLARDRVDAVLRVLSQLGGADA